MRLFATQPGSLNTLSEKYPSNKHEQMISCARSFGASDACLIPSADLTINEDLALKCQDPGCPNYGLSYSCPPFVKGPKHFKKLISELPYALVVRIIVPAASLLSWERVDLAESCMNWWLSLKAKRSDQARSAPSLLQEIRVKSSFVVIISIASASMVTDPAGTLNLPVLPCQVLEWMSFR